MPTSVPPSWPIGGPQPVKIAFVGEAPGDTETWLKRPLVGASGVEFDQWLAAAGIDRSKCLLTNVVDIQPEGNNFAAHCCRKEELPSEYPTKFLGPCATTGGDLYLRPELLGQLERLYKELEQARPNVVVALGATACWAVLGSASIGRLRGYVHKSHLRPGYKVVPTWHPASVLRQWKQRTVAIADTIKAARESASPAIVYDSAELWLRPTIADLVVFRERYMRPGQLHSVDIETMGDDITCIGIAPTKERAIIVPFRTTPARLGKGEQRFTAMTENYWPTHGEEMQAWSWTFGVLEDTQYQILGQNFIYDMQRLLAFGCRPRNFRQDTMLASWARWPEMNKGLDFLGSVHANFPNWKKWGARHGTEDKRDA